ncbi:MAG: glutathione S-transferase family protein [Pseudohongiellaceae bacterium]
MKKVTPKSREEWKNDWYDTQAHQGRFVRHDALFRNWITADGSPGPSGQGGFPAEAGRYHLYVSMACPWAHRTLIYRTLKNLDGMITVSRTRAYMGPKSWSFEPDQGRTFHDDDYVEFLYEIYRLVDPAYDDRATVPVLWDKQRQTIVSNESAEIIRMFNSAFDNIGASDRDLYPVGQREEINALNEWIYPNVNNGVYRAGFATTQEAYEEAAKPVFETLDRLEERLGGSRYLCGSQLTEADVRLFTTLVRFDAVYHGHFKCNVRRIVDYENLWGYVRDIYQLPGIAETVDMEFNKKHYYGSHDKVNPTLIVPIGPDVDFTIPHNRKRVGGD